MPPLRIVIDASLPPLEQLMYHPSQFWVAQTGHQPPVMTGSTIICTIENENSTCVYFRLTKLNDTFVQKVSFHLHDCDVKEVYVCPNLTAHSTLNMLHSDTVTANHPSRAMCTYIISSLLFEMVHATIDLSGDL